MHFSFQLIDFRPYSGFYSHTACQFKRERKKSILSASFPSSLSPHTVSCSSVFRKKNKLLKTDLRTWEGDAWGVGHGVAEDDTTLEKENPE